MSRIVSRRERDPRPGRAMTHRLAVLRRALAGPRLRRAEVAFLGFGISEYGVWVVVLVFAFRRGGPSAAGSWPRCNWCRPSVVAPLAARLIDARGAAATLSGGYVAQAISLGVTATLMLAGASVAVVYAGAVVAACAVTSRARRMRRCCPRSWTRRVSSPPPTW